MDGGKKRVGRKLLVASLGVATMTYGACGSSTPAPATDAAVEAAADGGADTSGTPFGPFDAGATADRQFVGNIIP